MEILVLSWRDPKHPLAGGAEQVMHEHMKGWVTKGHSVTFFSSHAQGQKRHETLDGIKIIRKGYQYLGVQVAAFFWYIFSTHPNFDLVVDEFHGIPFFTPFYVRKKILAVIQETAREVWLYNPLIFPLNIIVALIGYIFEPAVFLFYKNVNFMTGSSSAKSELVKFGISSSRVKIVNHGVVVGSVPNKIIKNKLPVILYFGRLAKDKGIEDAISTFSILDSKTQLEYWVFGKPETLEYGQKIIQLIKSKGLFGKIKLWNYENGRWIFKSDEDKYRIISRANIMINPSLREGWGLVNIEANHFGVPVIAYPSSGLVDSVKDGYSGIITKDKTSESLAREVVELISNKERLTKLKAGAKKWRANFSWQKSREASLTLIESIVTLDKV